MIIRYILISSVFLIFCLVSNGQEPAIVSGKVVDEKGKPLELVNVAISGLPGGTVTNSKGRYELEVPANRDIILVISFVGYKKEIENLSLSPGEQVEVNKVLSITFTQLPQIEVEDEQVRQSSLIRIDPKVANVIPTVSDGIPAILKTLPGVSSSNELSSQYSVRGGNFDENLVYVNDIEIYRPFLIRAGQQEGLTYLLSCFQPVVLMPDMVIKCHQYLISSIRSRLILADLPLLACLVVLYIWRDWH
ncbi:MAG: carboxypeptidase-like regulatory domain-containing protein [Bacteroidales bacterium]|nr:carboxypeptidase-like regulatory domain-containing protein [Bacteroidales bacterium]